MKSKSQKKFYADPTKDPEFKATQAEWYAKLAKEGFEDQEDESVDGFETEKGKRIDAEK